MAARLVQQKSIVTRPGRCLGVDYKGRVRGSDLQRDGDDPGDDASGELARIKDHIEDIVSANVRELRKGTGLGQVRFGIEAGTNVKQIESRDRRGRPETLWKIARAAGYPLWWLYVDRTGQHAPVELQQFLESPTGKKASPEEIVYLMALPEMLNRTFTYDAFYKAFEMLQNSSPKKTGGDE